MGDTEDRNTFNPVTLAAAAVDQNNFHVYPDWAAMQAYYGPRFTVPLYVNSGPTSHAPSPYMWAPPQSIIPPYGAPYAAFYAHGGVYAHPGVHLGGTALSTDKPAKKVGNMDGGFVKKLKEFDGLGISMGIGNDDNGDNAADRGFMKSEETEGSTDGSKASNVIAAPDSSLGKKRSRQGSLNSTAGNGKGEKQSIPIVPSASAGQDSEKVKEEILSTNLQAESIVNNNTSLELEDPSDFNVSGPDTPTNVQQSLNRSEAWLQNEQELKRERRKQSNRESARRSRLRKQAEAGELTIKVQALTSENMTLKSELTKLMRNSEKLKFDNNTLMEKLRDAQRRDCRLKPVGTVNLLARVDNKSDSTDRSNDDGDDGSSYDNTSRETKLHLLLKTSPRTDAVVGS